MLAALAIANAAGRAAVGLRVPDLVGYIAAGLIVGPAGLDLVDHAGGASRLEIWAVAADIGLVALMTAAGLSMAPHLSTRDAGRVAAFGAAILVGLVPAYLTAPWLMSDGFDPAGPGSAPPLAAMQATLALAVAVTSVPFITKVLANNKLLGTPFATTVLCTACIVDLMVWTLVPVVISLKSGVRSGFLPLLTPGLLTLLMLGCMALWVAASRHQTTQDRASNGDTLAAARVAVLTIIAALFVFVFGVSLMIAALGLGLGLGLIKDRAMPHGKRVAWLATHIFIPAFFVLVGIRLDLSGNLVVGLMLGFLFWSTAIKLAVVCLAALAMKMSVARSLSYGFALNTRGGPGIALATVTFDAGVIDSAWFVTLVFASIATTLMADSALRRMKTRAAALGPNERMNRRGRPPRAA